MSQNRHECSGMNELLNVPLRYAGHMEGLLRLREKNENTSESITAFLFLFSKCVHSHLKIARINNLVNHIDFFFLLFFLQSLPCVHTHTRTGLHTVHTVHKTLSKVMGHFLRLSALKRM